MSSALEEMFVGLLAQWRLAGLLALEAPEREYRFCPPRRWRFDFAWPARILAVEIEGGVWVRGRHSRGQGVQGDAEKYNAAAVGHWRVLRFTSNDLKERSEYVRDVLRAAM